MTEAPRRGVEGMRWAVLVAAMTIVGGCGGGAEEPARKPSNARVDASAEVLFEDAEELPLRKFRGRVVALELGCVGCSLTAEIYAALEEQAERFPDGVVYMRVDYEQSVKDTAGFYEKNPPAIHVLGDPTGKIGRSLPSQAMPTVYLFGKWGQMRYKGGFEKEDFETMVRALLAEEKPSDENSFLKKGKGPAIGDPLPDFTLPDETGVEVSNAEFSRGSSFRVLVFVDTSCPTCRAAMPLLASLAREMDDRNAAFLAVNLGGDRDSVARVYGTMDLPFPVLVDEAETTDGTFIIDAVPTVFVAGADGQVILRSLWNFKAVEQEVRILAGELQAADREDIEEEGEG